MCKYMKEYVSSEESEKEEKMEWEEEKQKNKKAIGSGELNWLIN